MIASLGDISLGFSGLPDALSAYFGSKHSRPMPLPNFSNSFGSPTGTLMLMEISFSRQIFCLLLHSNGKAREHCGIRNVLFHAVAELVK